MALLAALVLLVILFRLIKRRPRGRKGSRLGIVEFCELDQSRRLVLLRRDDVEHLVLIGGAQDLVVESGIGEQAEASQPEPSYVRRASVAPAQSVGVVDEAASARAPRAPVFAARRPMLRPVNMTPNDDEQNQT